MKDEMATVEFLLHKGLSASSVVIGSGEWSGWAPLHLAGFFNCCRVVYKLLACGADVNVREVPGLHTPSTQHTLTEHSARQPALLVPCFYTHPCDASSRPGLISEQAFVETGCAQQTKGRTALWIASKMGHLGAVNILLSCPDVDIDALSVRGRHSTRFLSLIQALKVADTWGMPFAAHC